MKALAKEVRNREERDRLVEKYLPLVHHIVGRIGNRLPFLLEREDLFSAGVLGLIHAAESYDPGKGASFKTYAYTAVRGAVLDEIRRQDPLSRTTRERLKRLELECGRLCNELGRQPTNTELAEALDLAPEEVDRQWSAMHLAQVLSFDDAQEGTEGLRKEPASEAPSPEARVETEERIRRLESAIAGLPEQQRQVIVLYHYEGLRLREIGSLLGVTESRVSQILSKAMTVLRLQIEGSP